MHPWVKILAAIGLAGAATYFFIDQHWLTGTAFLAGALAIVLPRLAGEELGDVGDADLMIRFVRNPFGTIVDEALDRIGQEDEQPSRPATQVLQPAETFDADAALERYLARKKSGEIENVAGPAAAPAPPIRTFGRKQA